VIFRNDWQTTTLYYPHYHTIFGGLRMQKHGKPIASWIGMAGALLFMVGLIVEYQYDLFPPGTGPLYIINGIMFMVAMGCILVMLWHIRRVHSSSSRFVRIALTGLPIGWAMLLMGGILGLISGNSDNLFFPLGGLTLIVFGLLAGIAVIVAKQWQGWARFTLLLQGIYYLLVMMILPPILTGSIEPTFVTETLWMGTWFLIGLALFVNERTMEPIVA
jgi:hypothetical protein